MRQYLARHGVALLVARRRRTGRGGGDDHQDTRRARRARSHRGPAAALLHHPRDTGAADRERRSELQGMAFDGDAGEQGGERRIAPCPPWVNYFSRPLILSRPALAHAIGIKNGGGHFVTLLGA